TSQRLPRTHAHLSTCLKALALFSIALAIAIAGCKKPSRKPSAAEIHAITQDLAAAARAHGAAVKARKSAIDADPASHDTIRIKLSGSSKAVPELLQELEQVAARNKLTQDEPSSLGNVLRVVLRRSGFETHEIEVETATARETEEGGAARL